MNAAKLSERLQLLKKQLLLPCFSYKTFPGVLGILLLSFGMVFWFAVLKTVDPIHHILYFYDSLPYRLVLFFLHLAGVMLWLFRKSGVTISPAGLICTAGAVAAAAFPAFTSLAVSLVLLTCGIWLCFDCECKDFSEKKLFYLVPALLFAFVFASGLEQQISAWNRLILLYSDWGIYFSGYRNLAESPFASFTQWLSIGNHFNPSVKLVMALVIRLSPEVTTLFAVNSFLIASIIPLIFILCRCLKLPLLLCAVCCCAAAFNPMLSHQHTALTYGYHPIIFLVPVVLLFCIARERKSLTGIILAALFMCGIKETVFIFASGVVLLFSFKKRWLYAAGTALILGSFFLIITQYILPHCDGGSKYFQLFQYNSLGSSVTEILLSPLLSPGVFWGKLFRPGNLSFVLLLLLPSIPAIWYARRFLMALLPILCGVLIKDCYLDQHNIVQWYGIEVTAWLFIGAVYGTACAYSQKKVTAGFIAALVLGSFAGFFLVGKTPAWGPCSASAVRRSPHIGLLREDMKKVIPASASAAVSQKWGAQLTETHRKLIFQHDSPDADYTVLDFSDTTADMQKMMKVRDSFLTEQKAHPVRFLNLRNCQVVIFKKGKGPWQLPFILNKSPEQLLPKAPDLKLESPGIRGRALLVGEKQKKVLMFLAVEPGFNKDLSLAIILRQHQEFRKWSLRWGYGIFPAYMMKKDHSFVVELPLPSHWRQISGFEVKTVHFERGK